MAKDSPELSYARKVLIAVSISVAAILLTAFIYYMAQLLILVFAGLLFSVFLSAPADLLSKYARIDRTSALGIVVVSLFVLVIGGGYLVGSRIAKQVNILRHTVPGALAQFERDLHKYIPNMESPDVPATAPTTVADTQSAATTASTFPTTAPENAFAEKLIQIREAATDFLFSASFAKSAGGLVSSTFGIIGNLVIILLVGVFVALTPKTYGSGALLLVPPSRRARVAAIIIQIRVQLQWWFVGVLCSMGTVGVLVYIGLSILGVPMAFTLALLAGVLNFVPYVGPIAGATPAIVIAFAPEGNSAVLRPALAAWTTGLYIVIQLLDGWFFTPFYQKQAVNIPPALIILGQVTFALLLGPIGLVLATPILACIFVLVRAIYIEDILGDRPAIAMPPASS